MAIRNLNGVGIHVVENPARLAAGWLIHTASEPGHIALSGGSASRAYELAAELLPEWRRDVHLWFGDDRAVAPGDERSNYRLVQQTLLDRLVALPTVHRIHGELGAPDAAELYDRELDGVTLDLAVERDRRRTGTPRRSFRARRRSTSGSGARSPPSPGWSRSSSA